MEVILTALRGGRVDDLEQLMTENVMQPGGDRRALFPEGGRLLIHRLQGVALEGADRVNLALSTPSGSPLLRFDDVPFDRDAGEVIAAHTVEHLDWSGP